MKSPAPKPKSRSKKQETLSDIPLPLAPEFIEAHKNPVIAALTQWRDQKRIPPVLLLSGPRGCGKRDIAYYLSQTLQCENAGFAETTDALFGALMSEPGPGASAPAPCGTCGSCLRALSGQSLDFREITALPDSEILKIDQFREMKESLGFSGYSGGSRIFLISDAERMNVQAANSILKILEEPPEGWIFLLTVSDTSLLPTTIVSRCQVLRMRPLPESVLQALLEREDLPKERIPVLVSLAQGSLSRARELADGKAWDMRGTLLQFLLQPQTCFHTLIDYAAAETTQFRILLDQFEQILNDLVLNAENPGVPFKNSDARKVLEDHTARCVKRKGGMDGAVKFWIDRSERLFSVRREMKVLNAKILAGDFLAPWMDAV